MAKKTAKAAATPGPKKNTCHDCGCCKCTCHGPLFTPPVVVWEYRPWTPPLTPYWPPYSPWITISGTANSGAISTWTVGA